MKAVCVYDDHIMPDVFIGNIAGEKTFGEIILKRVSVRERFKKFYGSLKDAGELFEFDHEWHYDVLKKNIKRLRQGSRIIHIFSYQIIPDGRASGAEVLFEKAAYSAGNYVIKNEENAVVGFIMNNSEDYCDFMDEARDNLSDPETYKHFGFDFSVIESSDFFDISVYSNFRNYITGGFDARFFNSVAGDEHIVKKTSRNKQKIKAEYTFYGLLPDDMKSWFVMPYDYEEDDNTASYTMKRYHMTDLAVRYVHGAIDTKEFEKIMELSFYFISHRASKTISAQEYKDNADKLYLEKVKKRVAELKAHPGYPELNKISQLYGNDYIDRLTERYVELYNKINPEIKHKNISVIGHGDMCFSNMLFDKNSELLLLIDPKGALSENDLWTDPYYDVAKLSHSICGRYDFFNNGLYRFDLDDSLHPVLEIDFDNTEYDKIFRYHLEENGFSYNAVRLYEASLFLSMLPLHMDFPKKVFGFMQNAEYIMDKFVSE